VWRHLAVKNVRLGLSDGAGFEQKRKKESVTTVVERWNERWVDRGVRVALEVRRKGERKRVGEKGKLRVIVEEVAVKVGGFESEIEEMYDEGLEKEFKKVWDGAVSRGV